MPSLCEEILCTLYDGMAEMLTPAANFSIGCAFKPSSFYKTVDRLGKDGYLKKQRKERRIFLTLTDKGKKTIREHRKAGRRFRPRWDGKWRLVIFDIPEKKSRTRDYLRNFLKTLGYGKVQRSIWISPYNFEKLVSRFIDKLDISGCCYQLTVEQFREMSGVELARRAWPIDEIQAAYRQFYDGYSSRLNQLEELTKNPDVEARILWKRFMSTLDWDYRSIAALDPHLPAELLPADWPGKAAMDFIRLIKNMAAKRIEPKCFQP